MNTAIKLFLALSLLLKLIAKVMNSQHLGPTAFPAILSYLFFIAAIALLILQLEKKYPIYSTILLLGALSVMGALLKKYHVSGGGLLMLLGIIAEFIYVFTLIQNKLLKKSIFHFLLGLSFLLAWVLACLEVAYEPWGYAKLMNYAIVAFSGTILLNKQAFHPGDKNVLIYLCVQSLFFILNNLSGIFS